MTDRKLAVYIKTPGHFYVCADFASISFSLD